MDDAIYKKMYIEIPSALNSYCKKRIRYIEEQQKINPAKLDILTFSAHHKQVEKLFNEKNFDLSSVLILEFAVVLGETQLKVEGEHEILGTFCLVLGTYEQLKKGLVLPASLKTFSLPIELFTLLCRDGRKKTNPKWVLKLNTLVDGTTELNWFNFIELMQNVQAEKDMKQFEVQRKFSELKQQEAVAQMAKQLANVNLPNVQDEDQTVLNTNNTE